MTSPGLVKLTVCGLAVIAPPGPPPPEPVIANRKLALDVRPHTSVIVNPKLEVPASVGVPVMIQVLSTGDVKLNPCGKLPDDTTMSGPRLNGWVQDVTNVTACLYD